MSIRAVFPNPDLHVLDVSLLHTHLIQMNRQVIRLLQRLDDHLNQVLALLSFSQSQVSCFFFPPYPILAPQQ